MKKTTFAKYFYAFAVLTGTVIGVGIFGLPYVALQAGFWVVVFYFILLVPVIIITHSLLGSIACGTKGRARIPGYAQEYLGAKGKYVSFVSSFLGLIGAQIAYLLVGGNFLYLLVSPYLGGTPRQYLIAYFLLGGILIYWGIKSVSWVELLLLFVFFIILGFLFVSAVPFIHSENLMKLSSGSLLLPYGVILFSLWGTSVIPEVRDMVRSSSRAVVAIITATTLISTVVYLLFVVAILGSTGSDTTPNALEGFTKLIGSEGMVIGYVFGLITTFTSFITLGLTLKEILWLDCKISPGSAWFIAMLLPLIPILLGVDNFISIIGLTGAGMLGMEAVVIIFMYRSFARRTGKRFNPLLYGLLGMLMMGVIVEIISFFA